MTDGYLIWNTVQYLLRNLGDSPKAVARELERFDCRGRPRDADYCPVAIYLRKHGIPGVSVSPLSAYFSPSNRQFLPIPVRDFVLNFDSGEYPELRL